MAAAPPTSRAQSTDTDWVDPFCDPKNPLVLDFDLCCAAAYKIKTGIIQTPCYLSHLSDMLGFDCFLKCDYQQFTGSFKERGARYTLLMLSEEQKRAGVVAASAGNHAQAVSYHGLQLGIPVTVVMPTIAPIVKIEKCKSYQATVLVQGKDMAEAKKIAETLALERGAAYINGYDHPHVLAGQGTIGLEICEQLPEVDAVVVPTGGGGLIAGISCAVKNVIPTVTVIGVESEKCPGFTRALEAGHPVTVTSEPSLADGLAVPLVGFNSCATAKRYVDKMILVKETWIATAILRFMEMERCVVEGAGATPLAAAIGGQLKDFKGKKVVFILSGANIDMTVLGRTLERALALEGRLIKAKVLISDRPNGMADLTKVIASTGVTIRDISQERAWVTTDVYSVEVTLSCETRDHEHAKQLQEVLRANYKNVKVIDTKLPCCCINKDKSTQ